MAWNEPGKKGQDNEQQGPPDLDKVFKDLSSKFGDLFGKQSSGKSSKGSGNGGGQSSSSLKPFVIAAVVIFLAIWALSGFFKVTTQEQAVILQFGQYKETVGPGLHWIPRLIQSETKLNVEVVTKYEYSAQMLTKDQNIVDVTVTVQYRIGNPKNYLYNLVSPVDSVEQATASALRQVIGSTTLDAVLTSGRGVVRQGVMQRLVAILQQYHAGIEITNVSLQSARAPKEVLEAFNDAIKAQEDEKTYQNQARAFANAIVPVAEGKAKRIAQEALAYKQQVVLQAKAQTARFDAIYSVYHKAPEITRERLYLQSMQTILQHSSKVFLDTKGNNNLVYLPLDKLFSTRGLNETSMPSITATSSGEQADTASVTSDASSSDIINDSYTATRVKRPSRSSTDNNPDGQVGITIGGNS